MPALKSQDIIEYLYSLGHFHNPQAMTGIRREDLSKLSLSDPEVTQAVKSFQAFQRLLLDEISANLLGKRAVIDGEIGPATEALLKMERCGCPDYPVPGSKIQAAEVEAATGSGSWAHSCEITGVHTVKVQVYKSRMPSFLDGVFEERVWPLVDAAYRDIGVIFRRVESSPNIDFSWERLSGSTIGLAIVPGQPMGCSGRIWAKFTPTYQPRDLVNQWARLVAHELGHNMRLQHTNGGIMNPSIVSGPFTTTAWRNDPSFGVLKRYFGGEPVDDPNAPEPEPPKPQPPVPPQGDIYLSGTVTVRNGDDSLGDFILVPKPTV